MSFVVVVADTDSASISLVSGAALETEDEAREALASWWTEQPASVQASSRAYVLDLERLAPVLIIPLVETVSPEVVDFLPDDPTRQTREAYEEPLEPIVEETLLVDGAIAESAVADAGVFVADELVPPPPAAVMDPGEGVVTDDGAMDSFFGEADETESTLDEIVDDDVLEEVETGAVDEDVLEASVEVIHDAEAEEEIAVDVEPAEAEAVDGQAQWAGDADVEEPVTSDVAVEPDDAAQDVPEDVVDEATYYGSTGLAPVAGLAEEAVTAEGEPDADVTPETAEVVADESAVAEQQVEPVWQEEAGLEGELVEYAAVESEGDPEAPLAEPGAYEPAPDVTEAASEPAASWPWEIEDDSGGASGAVASDTSTPAPAPAPEVREPLGVAELQPEAQAAHPIAGTATATAIDDAPVESPPEAPEHSAGAYEPGSIDMETYTCDDCIYEGTCPKKGDETPATCGSFQWRAP